MDKDEVKIQIKTVLDSLGADQAKAVLKELQAEAEGAGSKGKAGLDRFRDSTRGVTTAMRALRTVLGGLGIIALISQIAQMAGKIHDLVTGTDEYAKAAKKAAEAADFEKMASGYEKVKTIITETANELNRLNEIEDLRLDAARKMEDAQLKLAEEREVEALAADDPDRGLKEKTIRERYSLQRAGNDGLRAMEDSDNRQRRLLEEAAREQDAVNRRDAERAGLSHEARVYGYMAEGSEGVEETYRKYNKRSLGLFFGGSLKETQEASRGYREKEQTLNAKIDEIDKQNEASRRNIEQLTEKASIEAGGKRSIEISDQASGIVSARNVRVADEGVAKAERDRAAAREAAAEKERIEKRIAEQQERVRRSRLTEEEARLNLEDFDKRNARTTNTRQRDAARAPLEQAHKDSASARQAAERELAQYMAANKEYLQGVTALARDGKREIEKLKSRLAAGSCDAAGD
ncbi:MAG: hypothetical protein FWH21_00075 [Kiritimatiellaeota bacterium]|nr:hypothetical protein [Kiritimatiellota bacterium]